MWRKRLLKNDQVNNQPFVAKFPRKSRGNFAFLIQTAYTTITNQEDI